MNTNTRKMLILITSCVAVGSIAVLSADKRTSSNVGQVKQAKMAKGVTNNHDTRHRAPKGKVEPSKPIDRSSVVRMKTLHEIEVSGDYQVYNTADEIDRSAELILVASPLKAFLERKHVVRYSPDGGLESFYTLTDVKILKVIKQPDSLDLKPSELLQVIEPVGIVIENKSEKTKLRFEDYQELKKDSKYILFLKKGGAGKYSVINMNLGKFNLDGTDLEDLGDEDAPRQREKKLKFKKEVFKKYGDKLK